MPAEFYPGFFHILESAIYDVSRGLRKVSGKDYKVYRVGATIRCDITPHWTDPGQTQWLLLMGRCSEA